MSPILEKEKLRKATTFYADLAVAQLQKEGVEARYENKFPDGGQTRKFILSLYVPFDQRLRARDILLGIRELENLELLVLGARIEIKGKLARSDKLLSDKHIPKPLKQKIKSFFAEFGYKCKGRFGRMGKNNVTFTTEIMPKEKVENILRHARKKNVSCHSTEKQQKTTFFFSYNQLLAAIENHSLKMTNLNQDELKKYKMAIKNGKDKARALGKLIRSTGIPCKLYPSYPTRKVARYVTCKTSKEAVSLFTLLKQGGFELEWLEGKRSFLILLAHPK